MATEDLLKQIQAGVRLKPTKTNDRSKPVLKAETERRTCAENLASKSTTGNTKYAQSPINASVTANKPVQQQPLLASVPVAPPPPPPPFANVCKQFAKTCGQPKPAIAALSKGIEKRPPTNNANKTNLSSSSNSSDVGVDRDALLDEIRKRAGRPLARQSKLPRSVVPESEPVSVPVPDIAVPVSVPVSRIFRAQAAKEEPKLSSALLVNDLKRVFAAAGKSNENLASLREQPQTTSVDDQKSGSISSTNQLKQPHELKAEPEAEILPVAAPSYQQKNEPTTLSTAVHKVEASMLTLSQPVSCSNLSSDNSPRICTQLPEAAKSVQNLPTTTSNSNSTTELKPISKVVLQKQISKDISKQIILQDTPSEHEAPKTIRFESSPFRSCPLQNHVPKEEEDVSSQRDEVQFQSVQAIVASLKSPTPHFGRPKTMADQKRPQLTSKKDQDGFKTEHTTPRSAVSFEALECEPIEPKPVRNISETMEHKMLTKRTSDDAQKQCLNRKASGSGAEANAAANESALQIEKAKYQANITLNLLQHPSPFPDAIDGITLPQNPKDKRSTVSEDREPAVSLQRTKGNPATSKLADNHSLKKKQHSTDNTLSNGHMPRLPAAHKAVLRQIPFFDDNEGSNTKPGTPSSILIHTVASQSKQPKFSNSENNKPSALQSEATHKLQNSDVSAIRNSNFDQSTKLNCHAQQQRLPSAAPSATTVKTRPWTDQHQLQSTKFVNIGQPTPTTIVLVAEKPATNRKATTNSNSFSSLSENKVNHDDDVALPSFLLADGFEAEELRRQGQIKIAIDMSKDSPLSFCFIKN